ncbi:O-antigen acetylase [Actinomycetes bacterium]|nr:O-antigen acetylase [Actinomycetes bacterium]
MQTRPTQAEYFRSDIQGLRGIAVLLVVIYHTGVALPGGYIGVDIFFVISGFVITQLLLRETNATGTISLKSFYERRIKRILPAVAFAIIGTLLLSVFALSPFGEQQQVAQTARASSFFAANFYFYLQDSYWALAENPLRHLWSLAVEEQFYIFFPVLLLALNKLKIRINSRLSVAILIVISIISFVISYLLSIGEQILPKPELFAFFGTPWRMWEFLAGSLIALAPSTRIAAKSIAAPLSAISIAAIAWSAISFDSYTPFPGSAALIPVLATTALIYLGTQSNLSTKLLSARPLTAVGDISYSWYLWHWPLIVFAHRVFPASEVIAPISAALISVLFAIISLRKIENPIRHNSQLHGKRVLQLGAVCVLAPLVFSIATQKLSDTGLGLTELRSDSTDISYADTKVCRVDLILDLENSNCDDYSFGPLAKRILLVGDSAAGSISDAIASVAKSNKFNFSVYYANGCPTTYSPLNYRLNCKADFADIQKRIESLNPHTLIIANMGDLYVDGAGFGAVIRNFDGNALKNSEEATAFWIDNWRSLLNDRLKSQKVLVIQQSPLSAMREPILLQKFISSIGEPILLQKLFDEEVSLDNSDTRNMIVQAEAELFKNYKNVAVFDPASVLCDDKNCRQTLNGDALYYDGRHLTVKGSLLMVDGITKALQPLLAGG